VLSDFVLVVPVKPPVVGKSRLTGIDDDHRRALAQAFALDTLAVCLDV
jgi:2-phospho-L-lactate guanylyltransferase